MLCCISECYAAAAVLPNTRYAVMSTAHIPTPITSLLQGLQDD